MVQAGTWQGKASLLLEVCLQASYFMTDKNPWPASSPPLRARDFFKVGGRENQSKVYCFIAVSYAELHTAVTAIYYHGSYTEQVMFKNESMDTKLQS